RQQKLLQLGTVVFAAGFQAQNALEILSRCIVRVQIQDFLQMGPGATLILLRQTEQRLQKVQSLVEGGLFDGGVQLMFGGYEILLPNQLIETLFQMDEA